MMDMTTTTTTTIQPAEVVLGDRLIITPLRGSRFAMSVDKLYNTLGIVVIGSQLRINDPSQRLPRDKMIRLHSAAKIERVAS